MTELSLALILWDGPEPPPEIIAKVREDIRLNLEPGLDSPSDLLFHTVWLTKDPDGPTVLLFAAKQEGAFVGVYSPDDTEMEIVDLDSPIQLGDMKSKTVQMPAILCKILKK